ncbi:MAG: DUF1638 domain-containing protein [Candidatus Hydrogenedentes bacterium]|nr:DUF1638 domain-containing protein [Candidatus Hydrogenedentota bacterium]
MRLKCLGCEALARMVYQCAANSPHIVDVELFRLGLHSDPANLRDRLQEEVDAVKGEEYDATAMAYGLCGQATEGLRAGETPLVIPRAHDCITLFLGDRERYKDQFENHPGTFWYALDYVERREDSTTSLSLGSDMGGNIRDAYDGFVEKYGKENADYLMEAMGAWREHYNRSVYIDLGVGDGTAVEEAAKKEASRRGWTYDRIAGDLVLIRRLLDGDWEKDFLVLKPGQQIAMTYDDDVMGYQATAKDSV